MAFCFFWNIKSLYFTYSHLYLFVLSLAVIICHALSFFVTRCHFLSPVVTRNHSLSLAVTLVIPRSHSLCHTSSLAVIRCHSLSLDVPLICLSMIISFRQSQMILCRTLFHIISLGKPRKFYIRRNNNKADSIGTGRIVIAHWLP